MPVIYSPALAATICARIAAGESTYSVTRGEGMPNRRTLLKWRARHPEFAAQFAAAIQARTGATGIPARGRKGRPTDYSPAIAEAICRRVLEGETITRITRAEGMPSRRVVFAWLERHPDFAARYARAKMLQVHLLMDDILEIADDPTLSARERRVRVAGRKWLVERLMPKKYGMPG